MNIRIIGNIGIDGLDGHEVNQIFSTLKDDVTIEIKPDRDDVSIDLSAVIRRRGVEK